MGLNDSLFCVGILLFPFFFIGWHPHCLVGESCHTCQLMWCIDDNAVFGKMVKDSVNMYDMVFRSGTGNEDIVDVCVDEGCST